MAKKGEPSLQELPLLVIQNEVHKVLLELHTLDHRLAALQNAIGLEPAKLRKDGRAQWTDTHELALWVAIERGRDSLDTFVMEPLRWASRIPEGYPETLMPQDPLFECRHITTGEANLRRRISKRRKAGKWWRNYPGDTSE